MGQEAYDIDLLLDSWITSLEENYKIIESFANKTHIEELKEHEQNMQEKLMEQIDSGSFSRAKNVKENFEYSKKKLNDNIYYKPEDLNVPYSKENIDLSREEFEKSKEIVKEQEKPKNPAKSQQNLDIGLPNNINIDALEKQISERTIEPVQYKYLNLNKIQVNSNGLNKDVVNYYVDQLSFLDFFHEEVNNIKKEVEDLSKPASQYKKYIDSKKINFKEVINNLREFQKIDMIDPDYNAGLSYQANYRCMLDDADILNDLIEQAEIDNNSSLMELLAKEKGDLSKKIEEEKKKLHNFDSNFDGIDYSQYKNQKLGDALTHEAELDYLNQRKLKLNNRLVELRQNGEIAFWDSNDKDSEKKFANKIARIEEELKGIDEKIANAEKALNSDKDILQEFDERNLKNKEFAKAKKLDLALNVKSNGINSLNKVLTDLNNKIHVNSLKEKQNAEEFLQEQRNAQLNGEQINQEDLSKFNRELSNLRENLKVTTQTKNNMQALIDAKKAEYDNSKLRMNSMVQDIKKTIPGLTEIEQDTGFTARVEVLGRLQRGGSPSAHDRILAARLGSKAIALAIDEETSACVVGIKDNEIVSYDIQEAITMKHRHTHGLRDMIDMLQ